MVQAPGLRIVQIDAFTDRPFAGNPAAVVRLDSPASDDWMQAVAAEVNLSETAFLTRPSTGDGPWGLRWFTPTVEVDLCGHATLASAFHLFVDRGCPGPVLRFATRSGELTATRLDDGWIELDLPADPAVSVSAPEGLFEALGLRPDQVVGVARGRTDLLVEVVDAALVRGLVPDVVAIARLAGRGLSVSAAGDGRFDLVSRFFAPGSGIDEDPATGSAHCTLGPYWAAKLGRPVLLAHQASRRGGVLRVDVRPAGSAGRAPRVRIAGQAVHALVRS